MVIEQTIEIPADYRLFLELPRSIPAGVRVKVAITIPVTPPPNGPEQGAVLEHDSITARLNEVYAHEDSSLDPGLALMQAEALDGEDW
jgi:hypothetical protein